MSVKDDVIEMIRRLPEDVTIDEILYSLDVRAQIEQGIKELEEGKGIPHEEAMKRLSRWLTD